MRFEFESFGYDALKRWIGVVILMQLEDDSLNDALISLGDVHDDYRRRLLMPRRLLRAQSGTGRLGENRPRPDFVVLE